MGSTATLGTDYERRSFWQATMPPLPDRAGRPLPDAADVVVIGGGYAGINAARELARRGVAVTLLEANTLGWGASTRNGGIVHAGYKWGPRQLVKRYGEATGRALYRETLESYALVKRLIADEGIDCDFRETGHLELAYAPSHVAELAHARDGLASVGVTATVIDRDALHEEIGTDAYYGGLAVEGSGLLHPGRYFAGLAAAADRAGADLHEGVRATAVRRQGDGRFVVETAARRHPRSRRLRGDQRLHRWRRADAPPPGDPDRQLHHRERAAAARIWPTSCRRRAARSSTRRTSSTTGTSRPTAG